MQTVSKIMLKKAVKILSVIVIMWLVSLLTIVKEYKNNNKVVLGGKDHLYEQALEKFRKKFDNGTSEFRAWHLLPFVNTGLSEDEKDVIIKGYSYPPGADGKPVLLEDNLRFYIRQEIHKGWRDHAFNRFVSDLVPVNRTLLDPRDPWCKKQNFSENLPKATIIICFFDEAWSTLIRTITSVINRSPPHLIDQIILVDDYSTMVHLKKRLDEFVRRMRKVTLVRASRREGIIRARLLPIQYVKSPVIVYLDSHCECAEGWLEPLLQCIKENPQRVVTPVIDHIHESTFEYIPQSGNDLRLGGFNWDLRFNWIGIPQEVTAKRSNHDAPIATPTISGGLFAIHKDFFEKIGFYDEGFEIWGAENLELSFKTWMCGGSLEIVPCSHVGHLFRKRIPYEQSKKSLKRNYVRLAEVWLDEYAKYYFERIGNDKGEYGNLSSRIELRKKLNCKPFKWYLDNVYPQLEMPDKYVASGQIYSAGNSGLCLDACVSLEHFQESVKLLPCHFEGGNQAPCRLLYSWVNLTTGECRVCLKKAKSELVRDIQNDRPFWTYTSIGEIRRDQLCLDYLFHTITLFFCRNAATQVWLYNEKTQIIRHMATEQCLNIGQFPEGLKLVLTKCLPSISQRWVIEHFKYEKLAPQMQIGLTEWEKLTNL